MGEPRVFIIGGGLAGMVVAKELLKRGVGVTILEASGRLGGKAGADEVELKRHYSAAGAPVDAPPPRMRLDHGYHVFPGWYRNVRALLRELGRLDRLVDTDEIYQLLPQPDGAAVRQFKFWSANPMHTRSWEQVRRFGQNIFRGALPWHESLVSLYFMLDLVAERFHPTSDLDAIPVSGFLWSRFYGSESIANFHHQMVLQASSTPFHSLAAQTLQKVGLAFMGTPTPFLSILRGDLQTEFIDPFHAYLAAYGPDLFRVEWQTRVAQLFRIDRRLTQVSVCPPESDRPIPYRNASKDDVFILATPPEVSVQIFPGEMHSDELERDTTRSRLAVLQHLRSEPMAAFHVAFDHRLEHVPSWHTNLIGSRYGTSFIDISQHWDALKQRDRTVLSVIASNFTELKTVPEDIRVRCVLDELLRYLGTDAQGRTVDLGNTSDILLDSNIDVPLFLNTTGSWRHRPRTRTALDNLFVAGDYCQHEADLTTMEGAVMSGMNTARAVLETLGRDAAGLAPLPLDLPAPRTVRMLKYLALPVAALASLYGRLQRGTASGAALRD